ncbi:hypothetical protein Q4595_11245 [Wenyingzhuangia sp. 1_MG-2023]|nr:hypothetical protein [Wenyingzhuangia sp. 1_MG-2023]
MLSSNFFRENYSSPGLKDILNQSIRQYPEITSENKRTWKNIDRYLKHLKISERAAKIIDSNKENKNLWKLLHYEHIEPVSLTIKKLIELDNNPLIEDVENVMKCCEVIILSKEEANIIDGSIDRVYPLEGKLVKGKGMRSFGNKDERMNSLGIKIDKRYINNKL